MKLSDYESRISTANLKIINEFLELIEIEQLSMNTITLYRRILFWFFSEYKGLVSEITYNDISTWLENYEPGKAEQTINTALSALSSFFKFCLKEDYIKQFPIKKGWYKIVPDSLPKFLDNYDHAKVRVTAKNLANIRDKAIVELFDASGIRVGELHRINKNDINLIERTALVMGKGKKQRLVNFSEYCSYLLEQVMNKLPPGNGPLFLSQRKKRLSITSIQTIITNLGKAANLIRKLHPHIFRHTFATDLVNKGADLNVVASELGHEDPNTTRIYARVLPQEILNVYRRCME